MRASFRIESVDRGDGRRRLRIARPPGPVVLAVFWCLLAVGTVLTLGFAARETVVRCSRSGGGCELEWGGEPGTAIRIDRGSQPSPMRALWSGEGWLRKATVEANLFLSDPSRPDFELRRRSWPMALRVGAPFLLLAATMFAFTRRGYRLTLEQLPDALAIQRRSLLSTAHAPIGGSAANARASAELEEERGAEGVRLVLGLPGGERFAVTPWVASSRELDEVRGRIGAFLAQGTRSR